MEMHACDDSRTMCHVRRKHLLADIGNVVYGVEEITAKKLTGADKRNPTMNLPCRTVFTAGQKPIRVVGPVPELEDELLAPHRAYWK